MRECNIAGIMAYLDGLLHGTLLLLFVWVCNKKAGPKFHRCLFGARRLRVAGRWTYLYRAVDSEGARLRPFPNTDERSPVRSSNCGRSGPGATPSQTSSGELPLFFA